MENKKNKQRPPVWPHGDWDTTHPGLSEREERQVNDFYEKEIKPYFESEEPNRDCTGCDDCECGDKHEVIMSGSFVGPSNMEQRIVVETCGGNGIQIQDTVPIYKERGSDGKKVLGYTGHETVDRFLHDTLEIMRKKGHDYRQGNDADLIHNFRTVAETINLPMEKVWYVYFFKHLAALNTYVKEGGQSESEPIESRLSDLIVYLLLFHEMVLEKKKSGV